MRKQAGSAASATNTEGKEDRFSSFIYAVFVAVVLGAGGVIWTLVSANASLDKRVTLLEYKCLAPMIAPSGPLAGAGKP